MLALVALPPLLVPLLDSPGSAPGCVDTRSGCGLCFPPAAKWEMSCLRLNCQSHPESIRRGQQGQTNACPTTTEQCSMSLMVTKGKRTSLSRIPLTNTPSLAVLIRYCFICPVLETTTPLLSHATGRRKHGSGEDHRRPKPRKLRCNLETLFRPSHHHAA